MCCWQGRGSRYSCLTGLCWVAGGEGGETPFVWQPPLSQILLEERPENVIGQRLTVTGPYVPGELDWPRAGCFVFHLCLTCQELIQRLGYMLGGSGPAHFPQFCPCLALRERRQSLSMELIE